MKNLNYYLNLPWSFIFEWDDRDNIYIARITELKGCISHGDTIEEAAKNIREALSQHIQVMIKEKADIPEPAKPEDFKGNISYRTTPEKHYRLAKKAAVEGKSLNKIIDEIVDKLVA